MERHCSVLAIVLLAASQGVSFAAGSTPPIAESLRKLPLAFERNQGQAPPGVDFLARGAGYRVALAGGNAHIVLHDSKVTLRMVNAGRRAPVSGHGALPGKVNYFIGNRPERWHAGIPTFERVEYAGVYPGIDLAYYGKSGRLEYDFTVAPGVSPNCIRLAIDGARKVRLDAAGDLAIDAQGSAVRFQKPVAYQEIAGRRREVESRYTLRGERQVGFSLGAYDSGYAVVIDPALVYSTYLGGSGSDYGYAIAVGPKGEAYVTGTTQSADFPTMNPEQPLFSSAGECAFVTKLSVNGSSLLYSTYLCGTTNDGANSIAVDQLGNAYVTGFAESADFPLKNPIYASLNGQADGFIAKLSTDGSTLMYSTYLGGSGVDSIYSVAVDSSHNAYLAGYTASSDFPVTAGAYQTVPNGACSFVAKVNAAGAKLAWSTYFGQNCSAQAQSIAVDSAGSAYLTGQASGGFPVTTGVPQEAFGGVADAFVTKFSSTGATLDYSTYLGGSQTDYGTGVTVDASGNAYVTGSTVSVDFPITASVLQGISGGAYDGFVAKLNSAGSAWQYVTYLGGERDDFSNAITLDPSGNVIVAGYTFSTAFPTSAAVQPALGGPQEAVLTTTNGGQLWTRADAGLGGMPNGIAVDPASATHLAAATSSGLYQSTDSGAHWMATPSLIGQSLNSVAFSSDGATVYAGGSNSVYASSDGGATWKLAGAAPCNADTITVNPTIPATLYITSKDGVPCGAARSIDGGVNWTALGDFGTLNGVYNVAIDPASPSTLYASSDGGLSKSADAGLHWRHMKITGLTGGIYEVLLNPINPNILYVLPQSNFHIFMTSNAGKTWAKLTGVLAPRVLAIAPSNPSVLYAGVVGYKAGLYVTTDGGKKWSSAGLSDPVSTFLIDPTNANTLYGTNSVNANAFVAEVDPLGKTLLYSTYLGGSGGFSYDYGASVAVNSGGDALVIGEASSYDFPVTANAFESSSSSVTGIPFVARISTATPACSYSVTPASYLFYPFYPFPSAANFSVVAPSGCAWTPTPSDSWITVTSGDGPGTSAVGAAVAANTGATRTGTITIGSSSIAVTQVSPSCTYSLSPTSITFPQVGGTQAVTVTAAAGCDWNVTSLPNWITVTSGATGSGNGSVTLEAGANLSAMRSGGLYIAGTSVGASQGGAATTAKATSTIPTRRWR